MKFRNLFCSSKSTYTFNGKTITIEGNYHDVSIINGVLYVDGKRYEKDDSEKYEVVKVIVNGNVGKLDATDVEIHGDVSGDVDGTNISITGNVDGDIDGTNVSVGGSVHGDIDATRVYR